MQFSVKNRWTGDVKFTAEIDCSDDVSISWKLRLAVLWGIRSGADLSGANLSGAYLSGAYLSGANLSDADLSGAYLSDADLSGADLSGAYLRDANLSGADLSGAYLRDAYLRGADLRDSNLSGAHGVNNYVKCIQIDRYAISYTATHIQIGCQRHTHEEWLNFTAAQIRQMDGTGALEWWGKYKDWLFATISLCPAKPTTSQTNIITGE